jgi:hypothetical protein
MNPIEWLLLGAAWAVWNGPRSPDLDGGRLLFAALDEIADHA